MLSTFKRLLAGLALTAAVVPVTAAPAQATTTAVTSVCSGWSKAGATQLHLRTCAKRDGVLTQGGTTVHNFGNASFYVGELDVKMDFGNGYDVCAINAWIAPGQNKSCTSSWLITNNSTFAVGWVYYWNGSAYAWHNVNSPSI